MPSTLNLRTLRFQMPPDAVRIDRTTKWGNPFKIGSDGNRAQVIQKYRDWIMNQPDLLNALLELRGRDLVCWCSPRPCHGDVLLELANPDPNADYSFYET